MMWKVVFPVLAAVFAVALGSMPGAPLTIDVNDPRARELLDFAVAEQSHSAAEDMCELQIAKVVNVQRQLVSGLKYIITAEMAKTCRNGNPNDPPEVQRYECTFTVLTVPWLHQTTMLGARC